MKREITRQLQDQAVERYLSTDLTVREVAEEIEVDERTFAKWVKVYREVHVRPAAVAAISYDVDDVATRYRVSRGLLLRWLSESETARRSAPVLGNG